MLAGAPLIVAEREEISRGCAEEETFTDIAAPIGRHKSPVSREVGPRGRDDYWACVGQQTAVQGCRRLDFAP